MPVVVLRAKAGEVIGKSAAFGLDSGLVPGYAGLADNNGRRPTHTGEWSAMPAGENEATIHPWRDRGLLPGED